MSAILAVIQNDKVHLLADGAFYDPDSGVLTDVECKVRAVPGLNAVYSSRGISLAFELFEVCCRRFDFQTFDELVAALPTVLNAHDTALQSIGHIGSEIVVAGWSESRGRGEVYARQSHTDDNLQMQRGLCYRWVEGRIAFGIDFNDLPKHEAFVPGDAVEAFQLGRKTLVDLHCGESSVPNMGYAIGGAISHIEIGPDGYNSGGILHHWPDLIGEPIDPFRVENALRCAVA